MKVIYFYIQNKHNQALNIKKYISVNQQYLQKDIFNTIYH